MVEHKFSFRDSWIRCSKRQLESGYGKFDFGTPTDDDEVNEVTLPWHDRATEVLDFPDTDICDRQTLIDTQREDWLMQTEPLHGARPTTFGSRRWCRWPEAGPDPSVVAGTADLDGRGGENTTARGSSSRRNSGFTTEGGGGGVRLLSLRVYQAGYKLVSLLQIDVHK